MTTRFIRRTIFFGLLLPFLYFGTASATFLFRLHAENGSRTNVRLPVSPRPKDSARILIFSPHIDDETLGCGGLIQQAARVGAEVQVVFLTNGDGFRVAVERQYRALNIGPADYIRFAGVRQAEAFHALRNLGVPRDKLIFLGYPDRGLTPMWNEYWAPDRPFRSAYTGSDRSPYDVTFRPGAVYCGQNVLQDISGILRDFRPTDVYVTHPSDDHPDHSAASAFVTLAIQRLREEGLRGAHRCQLRYYLVHRGDWPVPQGLQKSDQLVPPSEMLGLDTRWTKRPLSEGDVERKSESILDYASQTAVMKRFLVSFARCNELFGQIEDSHVARVADGRIHLDGNVEEWQNVAPAIEDPVNDNLLRDFQAGGDVQAIFACRDSRNLYLRVDTREPVSERVEFKMRIRYFGDPNQGGSGGSYAAVIRARAVQAPTDIDAAVSGNRLEVAVPLRDIGYSRRISLNLESSVAGLQVDQTGYRFLDMAN